MHIEWNIILLIIMFVMWTLHCCTIDAQIVECSISYGYNTTMLMHMKFLTILFV